MKDFLKDYGTLILAIYGIVQVWFIAIWKNYLRKGKLNIFRTGRIEVGYSNFGPSIALNGTLVAKNKDIFVNSISINVTRIKDNALHKLDWAAFRSPLIPIGKVENITIEIPSGFIVRRDSPHRYHIFFADTQVQKELSPSLEQLRNDWINFLGSKSEQISELAIKGIQNESIIQILLDKEFPKKSKSVQNAWDTLRSKVFWEPGKYNAVLKITTDIPGQYFEDKWNFSIEQKEVAPAVRTGWRLK